MAAHGDLIIDTNEPPRHDGSWSITVRDWIHNLYSTVILKRRLYKIYIDLSATVTVGPRQCALVNFPVTGVKKGDFTWVDGTVVGGVSRVPIYNPASPYSVGIIDAGCPVDGIVMVTFYNTDPVNSVPLPIGWYNVLAISK